MSDTDSTEVDSQFGDLVEYGRKQEELFLQELLEEEKNQDLPIVTEYHKEINQKYSKFLTQKVYGKGAFGMVTEQYDIFQRQRQAKKIFARLEDYAVEKNVLYTFDKLFKEEIPNILMKATKYDATEKSICYQSGNCSLHEYCEKRRQNRVYWWNNKEELNYIICRMFELVKILYSKDVFHSDLKPANLILEEQFSRHFSIKLIDLGGATYAYHYLTAITESYFPNMDIFNCTENKQKRIYAEFHQLGRIIQEILLSSIYAHSEKIFRLDPRYQTFKLFMQEYFHLKDHQKTNKLLKQYYDKEYTDIIEMCLDLKSPVANIEKKVQELGKNKQESIQDIYGFVSEIEQQKITKFFTQTDNEGVDYRKINKSEDLITQNILDELEFYYIFEQDKRGYDKCNDLFTKMAIIENNQLPPKKQKIEDELTSDLYDTSYEFKLIYKNPLLSMYQTIFAKRLGSFQEGFFDVLLRHGYEDADDIKLIKSIIDSPKVSKDFKMEFFNEVYCRVFDISKIQYQNPDDIQAILKLFGYDKTKDEYTKGLIQKFKLIASLFDENKIQQQVQNGIKQFQTIMEKDKNMEKKCVNNIIDIKRIYLNYNGRFKLADPDIHKKNIKIANEIYALLEKYYPGEVKNQKGFIDFFIVKEEQMFLQPNYFDNLRILEKKALQTEEYFRKYMPEQQQVPDGMYLTLLVQITNMYDQYTFKNKELFLKWYRTQVSFSVSLGYLLYIAQPLLLDFHEGMTEEKFNDKQKLEILYQELQRYQYQGENLDMRIKQYNLQNLVASHLQRGAASLQDRTVFQEQKLECDKIMREIAHVEKRPTADVIALEYHETFMKCFKLENIEEEMTFYLTADPIVVNVTPKEIGSFFLKFFIVKRIFTLLQDEEILEKHLEILEKRYSSNDNYLNQIKLFRLQNVLYKKDKSLITDKIIKQGKKSLKNPDQYQQNFFENLINTAQYATTNQFVNIPQKKIKFINSGSDWQKLRKQLSLTQNKELIQKRIQLCESLKNVNFEEINKKQEQKQNEENTQQNEKQQVQQLQEKQQGNEKKDEKIQEKKQQKNTQQDNKQVKKEEENKQEKIIKQQTVKVEQKFLKTETIQKKQNQQDQQPRDVKLSQQELQLQTDQALNTKNKEKLGNINHKPYEKEKRDSTVCCYIF